MGDGSDLEQGTFRRGMKSGAGIAIGYIPIALAYGLLAKTTGLSMLETVLISMIVYAGAAQYTALNLLAIGTGAAEIIVTTFMINIRHFLLSASLQEKSSPKDSLAQKAAYSFGITDETFSVAALEQEVLQAGFMFGLNTAAYSSWVVFSAAGYLFGSALPPILQESMTIGLYAMFIGLLVPSLKGKKVICLAGFAACLNMVFTGSGLMGSGWAIAASAILSSVLTEAAAGFMRKGEDVG